jgi:hypothetical protein
LLGGRVSTDIGVQNVDRRQGEVRASLHTSPSGPRAHPSARAQPSCDLRDTRRPRCLPGRAA